MTEPAQGPSTWVDRAATVTMVILGAYSAAIAIGSGLDLGVGDPAVATWGVFGAALLAAAYGRTRRARWASPLTIVLAIPVIVIPGFLALFGVLLLGGDLSRPMLGLPVVGVLNGWLSLAVFGAVMGAGVLMVAAARGPITIGPRLRVGALSVVVAGILVIAAALAWVVFLMR